VPWWEILLIALAATGIGLLAGWVIALAYISRGMRQ